MGIVLASNFDVKTNLALDSRTNKNTIEERNAIPTEVRFEGLECYVKEDGGLYRLTGGVENSNWSLIPYTDADGNLTIDGNLILNNSSTPINIKEYIDTLTAAGIHYIGTLDGTESSPGSFTPAAEVGDMYIVSTAGYINGVEVEVGDSILCHTDTEAAGSSTYTSINSNWNYVQANISTMRGATSDTPGMSGIVPIPSAGSENKYLKGDGTWSSIAQSDVTDLVSDLESKADKQTPGGGFAAGNNASAISGGAVGDGAYAYSGGAVGDGAYAGYGGAVGSGASAGYGGAVGNGASAGYGGAVGNGAEETYGGGAVGSNASAGYGGAVGNSASATEGGAVGNGASATSGGAIGSYASTTTGGAVGQSAKTGNGFAGGASAKAVDGENNGIDAIQLGTGTNSTAKTLQVYDYQLMTADGNIPSDRLKNSNGGFAAGNGASATYGGGAVGSGASATSGGAVGSGASTNTGGAVGQGSSTTEGGAVGYGASTEGGGAVGRETSSTLGGAVGQGASTTYGGAVGGGASSGGGGAVGQDTTTDGGGAVGYNATSEGGGAVGFKASAALGGTVGQEASALNGGAVGFKASASGGGAVGSGASTTVGGAVGQDAISGNGFAGGNAAKTVSSTDEPIDAVQLGTGTNSTAKTLQVYEYQLMDSTGNIPLDRIQSALDESGISGGQETAHTHANKDVLDGISSSDITNWNNKADKQNSNGGFVGGSSASATSGGAVGNNASATYGGAVGNGASATYGGAVGSGASANTGGAVGSGASTTTSGGAVGNNASATSGGAIGSDASTTTGGAVGWNAKTSTGFAGGYNAKTQDSSGDGIDAIQLGTGTNSTAKTLQVYDYQLMTADGNIPSDRLKNSNGGFAAGDGASTTFGGAVGLGASAASGGAVGNGASATYGGAVGLDASATYGGAVGNNAKTGNGFAGGYNAKTQTSSSVAIDAIQLGTGTNSTAKTLQIYNYRLMDSTGNIPLDRIQSALDESGISGGQETAHTHANKNVLDGISSSDITNWNNKADKQNSNGGFAAGDGATVSYGGAVGNGASATSGGAVGNGAEETNGGFAGGNGTTATYGGAVGNKASTTSGGAVGNKASTTSGGAVGDGAKTSTGFAGGYNAKTQDSSGDGIDAIQLGTGTNSTAKTLQVYNYQLMDSIGNIPKERLKNSSGGFAAGNGASASPGGAVGNGASATIGGAVGNNAHATYGGAVGSSASATYGGAVGQGAKTSTGFAGGAGAKTQDSSGVAINAIQLGSGTNSVAETLQVYEYKLMDANGNIPKERLKNSNGGFAAGDGASTISGGAVGDGAYAVYGGAVGSGASSNTGGAVGYNAKTSTGFAGGYNAKTQDSSGDGIDAIQLGTGTNSTAKTLQVYNYQLMDANGNIPSDRLKNSKGGFAAGDGASTTIYGVVGSGAAVGSGASTISGGAVGNGAYTPSGGAVGASAYATSGGAIGQGAKTGNGFAGGYNAKTQTSSSVAIDAIQLGSGTNSTAKTLQVYNYQLMDASGNVPSARLTQAVNSMGSDFAESLEWLDGNPNNEDRRGLFVTLTSDENNEYNKIKLANSDDEIVGVVSSIPTVVGNSCNDNWKGKYQTDIFGKPLTQIVHHEAVYEDVEVRDKDEDGNLLKTTHNESVLVSEAYDTEEYILSSEYDPSQEYIPRLKRKEWASIGFIGQLIVVDDGTCIPGKKCKCGNNGVGTLSNDDTGYRVLSRIDNTHIKILLK